MLFIQNKKSQKEKITEKKTINTTKQITSNCTKNDYEQIWYKQQIKTNIKIWNEHNQFKQLKQSNTNSKKKK